LLAAQQQHKTTIRGVWLKLTGKTKSDAELFAMVS